MSVGYAKAINGLLKEELMTEKPFVLFGQNVAAGSCLSGLTRGLKTSGGLEMFNTPNCENAMVGFGFGMMMRGVNSAFVVKQHDFLLLTLDHMVNTYNIIKLDEQKASFTIICVVVDSGYEGPQSRLNNLGDFCSLADISTYSISSQQEATSIVPLLTEPGFRIIALSQRLFHQNMRDLSNATEFPDKVFRYGTEAPSDLSVVSFNFALPQALELQETVKEHGKVAEVFSITNALPKDFSTIIQAARQSKKVVILDDSRSINRSSDRLHLALLKEVPDCTVLSYQKQPSIEAIRPNIDAFTIDQQQVLQALFP